MGLGIFGSFMVLALFFKPFVCQKLNTDESFVIEFLQKMGFDTSKESNFSGSICSLRGVVCDSSLESVVSLELSGLGLSGVIPDTTIGKLVKLEMLDLSKNKITDLPSDLWSLGSLKSLNLSFNQISGNLPSNIGNFGQLRSLDLSFNKFSGSIPEAISSVMNLRVLNLSGNEFESEIPLGLLQCRFLVSIDLSVNKLSGSLPTGFSTAFPDLQFLNLAGNEIFGGDSDFLGMKVITYLNISSNLFKGPVFGIFEGPLEVIDLSKNQFQGHIAQVSSTSKFSWMNLRYLDLSDNNFSGEFLSDLSYAQNLRHLNLAHNGFTEQLFAEFSMLTNLEYMNLSGTNLIGKIPNNISDMNSLKVVDLSHNHLSNHIPPRTITENLLVLDLSYNNLTGDIPLMGLKELHRMEWFNFSYNNLSFCASQIHPSTVASAFIGSVNSCPIAANPAFFKRKAPKHGGLKLALALTLSMVCLLVGLLLLAFGCRRKTRMWAVKQSSYKEEETVSGPFSFQTDSTMWVADVNQATTAPVVIFEKPLLNFTFADLVSATCNFGQGALLAEGKFGPVYGGVLPGRIHVALKVSVQGSAMTTDEEAVRELEYLGRIKHPNLVPLCGYCMAGGQRIAIYDYMENGNLQNLLYELPRGVQTTDAWDYEHNGGIIQNVSSEGSLTSWRFRHKVALGTARALAFLHHGCSPPIIHRDVKASSVYLDSNLVPRLSEFGLARIFGNGIEDETTTELLVPPMPKSDDVYEFGVFLFQLMTGKKPIGDDYAEEKEGGLVNWVRGLVKRSQVSRAIDPKIRGTGPDAHLDEALKIGYLCTAQHPLKRPTMQQVVGLLKDLDPDTHQLCTH